jgi:hypothetical protein
MKKTVFLIYAYGGEYDDAWQSNLCCRLTEESANEYVDGLIEKDRLMQELGQRLNQHLQEWTGDNPSQWRSGPDYHERHREWCERAKIVKNEFLKVEGIAESDWSLYNIAGNYRQKIDYAIEELEIE